MITQNLQHLQWWRTEQWHKNSSGSYQTFGFIWLSPGWCRRRCQSWCKESSYAGFVSRHLLRMPWEEQFNDNVVVIKNPLNVKQKCFSFRQNTKIGKLLAKLPLTSNQQTVLWHEFYQIRSDLFLIDTPTDRQLLHINTIKHDWILSGLLYLLDVVYKYNISILWCSIVPLKKIWLVTCVKSVAQTVHAALPWWCTSMPVDEWRHPYLWWARPAHHHIIPIEMHPVQTGLFWSKPNYNPILDVRHLNTVLQCPCDYSPWNNKVIRKLTKSYVLCLADQFPQSKWHALPVDQISQFTITKKASSLCKLGSLWGVEPAPEDFHQTFNTTGAWQGKIALKHQN